MPVSESVFDLIMEDDGKTAPELATTLPGDEVSELHAQVPATENGASGVEIASANHLPDGGFAPGNKAALLPRKPKTLARKRYREYAHAELLKAPSFGMLELVAKATGIPIGELMRCADGYEVQAKVNLFKSLCGSMDSFREQHDRLDPKVTKAQHEHSVARPMPPTGDNAAENLAAADFFENLNVVEDA